MNKLKIINYFVNCARDYGAEVKQYKGFKVLRADEFIFMYWESFPYDGIQIENIKTHEYVYILRSPAGRFYNGDVKEVWSIIDTVRRRREQQKQR